MASGRISAQPVGGLRRGQLSPSWSAWVPAKQGDTQGGGSTAEIASSNEGARFGLDKASRRFGEIGRVEFRPVTDVADAMPESSGLMGHVCLDLDDDVWMDVTDCH